MDLRTQHDSGRRTNRCVRRFAVKLLPLPMVLLLAEAPGAKSAVAASPAAHSPERGLVSSQPAHAWEQALISGNGRMGALVYGPPVGAEKFGFSFQAKLTERNLCRQQQGWLANLSTNRLHYSWDWDDVHFVMLGIYPADRQNPLIPRYNAVWHDPQGALTFLKADLAKCVGASGRPVVLMSHCGFDTDWWHPNDWRAVYAAGQPYHVVLYLYGHSGTGQRTWAPPGEEKPWQCLNTGQTENGFFVVQFLGDKLRAAYRRKHWPEAELADGKTKRAWEGTWEWQHTLDTSVSGARTNGDAAK